MASPTAPTTCSSANQPLPSLNITTNGVYVVEPWFDGSSVPSIESYLDAYSQKGVSALAEFESFAQTSSSSPETWELGDQAWNDFNLFAEAADTKVTGFSQGDQVGGTAGDIKELSELSIRIHSMVVQDTVAIPCDDVTDATRCLLKINNRAVRHNEQRLGVDASSPPLSPPVSTQQGLPDGTPAHLLHPGDRQQTLAPSETATAMMILACYQQLLDLFKQVCCVLQKHTVTDDSNGSDAYFETYGVAADHVDEDHSCSYSVAQVAMITGLISHLLNQLDRGLQRHFGTSTPNSPIPSPAPSHATTESTSPTTEKHHDWFFGTPTTDKLETGTCQTHWGAMNVVAAMFQTHQSLHRHIDMIKESVRTSRNV